MANFYFAKVVQNEGGKGGAEGRVGTLTHPENPHFPAITIQSPAEYKGPAAEDGKSLYWTPEDLFVASHSICIFTTFVAIAENSKLEYKGFEIEGKGKLEKTDEGVMFTEIEETVTLTLPDEKHIHKAKRVLEKTEKHCLIANSMKTKCKLNVEFKIEP